MASKRFVLVGFLLLLTAHPQAWAESDEEWGCKVLMCLANPKGPKAAADCVDPIDRMYDAIRATPPRAFPQCASAGGAAGTKRGFNYYDECPTGTSALDSGVRAVQLSRAQLQAAASGQGSVDPEAVVQGMGTGEGGLLGDYGTGRKICVSNQIGTVTMGTYDDPYSVRVYERIVTMDAATSPRYIDVYISGQKHSRIRW